MNEMSTGFKIGLGALGTGLLGGLVYLATRPVSSQTERLAGVPGAADKDETQPAEPVKKGPQKLDDGMSEPREPA